MSDKKISVIIPCYNVEKYISRCIDSLLNQTYKNMEIILVDDCSTDNTFSVLKKYEKEYKNVIVIKNEKNSGAGYSRNIGVKNAKYDIISFIDSDDWIEDNYYEEMLNKMNDEKSDVVVCDIYLKYEDKNTKNLRMDACINKDEKINYINNGLAASPCNKIFHKNDLMKYPFPEGIMNEDVSTVLAILINSKKISYCSKTYYNYYQNNTSVQNSSLSEKRFDIFKAINILKERIPINSSSKKYWEAIIFNQLALFLIYVIPKEKNFFCRAKYLRKYKKAIKEYSLNKNEFFNQFLINSGKKHQIYYRMLIFFECHGMCFIANILISLYKVLFKILRRKTVITKGIDLELVKKAAIKQKNMKDEKVTISVVVPNYNYEKFMYERLYSILNQNYKIAEIIILDDCSKDESRIIIDEIEKNIKPYVNITKIYNDKNSGSPFKQWKKGFDMAKGDYVWIAEADDYCEANFLREVAAPVEKNSNIMISYCDTAFINTEGNIILKSIKPEIDIQNSKHWDRSYINNGLDEVKEYSFLNCTIANVSSCIVKRKNYDTILNEAGNYKQAGDWLFYVDVMAQGDISFINKPLNYYRVHGNNVSSTMNHQRHIDELNKLHKYYTKKYNLTEKHQEKIKKRVEFLEKVWKLK